MRSTSLRRQLSITYAGVALLTALALGAILLTLLRLYYDRQELDYLANNARYIASDLSGRVATEELAGFDEGVARMALSYQARVRLLDAQDRVLADSGSPWDVAMEGRVPRAPIFRDSPESRSGRANADSPGNGSGVSMPPDYFGPVSFTLYGIEMRLPGTGFFQALGLGLDRSYDSRSSHTARVPILGRDSPDPVGWVELAEGPSYGRQIVIVVAWAWGLASGMAVLLAAAAGWLASRHIARPISSLTSVTSRMAEGDLAARVSVARTDEIGVLSRSFNLMAERVEATVAALSLFVADAAHEIHTPLTALRANLELAADEENPDRRELFLERARDQARRMEELTDDLLDLSRLETDRSEGGRRPLDVGAILRETSEAYASRAEQKGIAFLVELSPGPATILGVEPQVRRALANLLDNAVKFTPGGGTIRVALALNGGWVELSVADDGVGIPPEDLPKLFGRFRRGRNVSAFPGSGLGLAIVKAIMDRHGGQLRARNLNPGAELVLSWPAAG